MAERVFVNGKTVGVLIDGVFRQRVGRRQIFNMQNSKGMDVGVNRRLKGVCHNWHLEMDSGESYSIPFLKIEKAGKLMQTGAGYQYMVGLEHFEGATVRV
jgi:hypothetical protein